ncbi:MAG: flagellar motor protein MotB [Candidatus Marinimicrobia bacterium]|nr:flagellar motor protein MotB [Candidatus Neomarinimicrobiota bacterium]
MAITPQEKKKYLEKGRREIDEGLPGWFGTFADMMTLLFAFFVLVAAMSTIDPVKLQQMADAMGKSVGKKIKVDNQAMNLSDVKKEADKIVEEMEKDPTSGDPPVEVNTSQKGISLEIKSDISFKSGLAELTPKIFPILKKIAPLINKSPFQIAIEGHTDNQPISEKFKEKYPSNWELSSARAAVVTRELIKLGVSPTRLQAVGYSKYIPRDRPTDRLIDEKLIRELNATKELMSRNRRVEITFLAPAGATN